MSEQDALRRYLLHRATTEQREAIEQEYFADEAALDAVAAEEEALIEDYLRQRLTEDDRVQFERVYGSSPDRRVRVQLSRALDGAASRRSHRSVANRRWVYGALAVAAAVLLAASAWFGQRNAPQTAAVNPAPSANPPTAASSPPQQPDTIAPQNPSPRVVALTISPIAVRGVAEADNLIVPPGTDLISLTVEGLEQSAVTSAVRAVVRTVEGQEAWQGNALSTTAGSSRARFEIPADRLPPNDYIVTVYGLAGNQDRELQRYSLRVRAR